jgi:very-short-patch-repair endonuclease
MPLVNGFVDGLEVDFHWPAFRPVVETDGSAFHRNPIAFERDRRRDLALEAAGWHVLRISWRQLLEEPEHVATTLAALLAR